MAESSLEASLELEQRLRKQILEELTVSNQQRYDVTLITQTSTDRLFFFQHTSKRWMGPMSVAVFFPDNLQDGDQIKREMFHLDRIHYEFFVPKVNEYPYNTLRNIAIDHVNTTHYFVCDMDLWPADNLYATLVTLPEPFLQDDWLALIIPAFEYRLSIPCNSFQNCVNKVAKKIPHNKKDLRQCLRAKDCKPFRAGQGVHDYHYSRWMDRPETTSVSMVNCFKSDRQEPYVMVKRSPHLPRFYEAFVNYGKDKISWIENLRYIGYKFGVVTQSFATDIPHPKSTWFNDWAKTMKNEGRSAIPSEKVYAIFYKQLRQDPDRSVVHFCDKDNQ